jgi:hypothetical protein
MNGPSPTRTTSALRASLNGKTAPSTIAARNPIFFM